MHVIETDVFIDAPAERVWSLLVDFPGFRRRNPFILSAEGQPEVGSKLEVFIQPAGAKGMRFRPTVMAVEKHRELRWKGKLLLPGLMDGEHYFKLQPRPDGGTLFQQGELFSGILVPFFKGALDGGTRQGFIAMNLALKREAEAFAQPAGGSPQSAAAGP
jgi:hypothetical protein